MTIRQLRTIPFLLHRVDTGLNDWHADFRKLGLSVLSVRVMTVLALNGAATVNQLAEIASIDQSTLSHILRRLTRVGLINKTRQKHDHRSVIVAPSEKGRPLAKRCLDTAIVHHRLLTRGLTPSQIRVLEKALDRLYANVISKRAAR